MDTINKQWKIQRSAVYPVTEAQRQLIATRDELCRVEKFTDYCGRSLITRISKSPWADLSANQRYEVDGLSVNFSTPTANTATATASMFMRLKSTGINASTDGSGQVSTNHPVYPVHQC